MSNPHPQWIIVSGITKEGIEIENPAYKAWAEGYGIGNAEGYSKGYAEGQIKALKETLEDLDRIFTQGKDDLTFFDNRFSPPLKLKMKAPLGKKGSER